MNTEEKAVFMSNNIAGSPVKRKSRNDVISTYNCKNCYFVMRAEDAATTGKCRSCGVPVDNARSAWSGDDDDFYRRNIKGMPNSIVPTSVSSDSRGWYDEWVYNESLCQYHNLNTGHSIQRAAFDVKFSREPDCDGSSASKFVSNIIETVAGTMYWPGNDDIFTTNGLKYVNTYRPHVVPPERWDDDSYAAQERMISHAYSMFDDPKDAEILLDWLAYVIQNPGNRVNWAVVIGGIEGNGKSYWKELMKRMLGKNAGEVSGNTVKERFTDWAIDKQFIAIEEIMVSSRDKYDVVEKLKPFITNDTVDVEGKGVPSRTIPNFASYMLLTNHSDAIPFRATDRRYCVLWTKHRTLDDLPSAEYFADLFSDLDRHSMALYSNLQQRKLGQSFNPKGRAPATGGRAMMMEATRSGPVLAVEEAIEWVDNAIINSRMVDLTQLKMDMQAVSHIDFPKSDKSIGKALTDLGYVKCGKMKVGAQRRNHYFYIAPQNGMTEDEAREVLRIYH